MISGNAASRYDLGLVSVYLRLGGVVFKLPSVVVVVVGLLAGLLAVLNTTVFGFGPPWLTGINIALLVIPAFGITPLLGAAWRTALNLTPGESSAVIAVLTALQLWQQSEPLSVGLHAVIQGVLVVAAALGFGVNAVAVVQAERGRRVRV